MNLRVSSTSCRSRRDSIEWQAFKDSLKNDPNDASEPPVDLSTAKITLPHQLVIFVGAFVAVYLLIMLVTPLNTFFAETLFSRLPNWLFLE